MSSGGNMVKSNLGMTYIRPCVTEAGKISAETHLGSARDGSESSSDFLDSSKLCWLLNLSQIFSGVKCSQNLGIAKIEFNGKTVVVSKGGRINVRTAENKEDALETTWLVSKAMWPAMICARCGKAILECISGWCGKCRPKDCPLLVSGPPKPTQMLDTRRDIKTVNEILQELDASGSSAFKQAKQDLGDILQILGSAVTMLSSGNSSQNEVTVRQKLEEATCLAQRLIVEGHKQIDMSAGLILLGISTNLEMLSQIVGSLAKVVLSHPDHLLLERTWNVVISGYKALWRFDPAEPRRLEKSYAAVSRILSRTRGKGGNIDFLRSLKAMAKVCLYLSRIASMSLVV